MSCSSFPHGDLLQTTTWGKFRATKQACAIDRLLWKRRKSKENVESIGMHQQQRGFKRVSENEASIRLLVWTMPKPRKPLEVFGQWEASPCGVFRGEISISTEWSSKGDAVRHGGHIYVCKYVSAQQCCMVTHVALVDLNGLKVSLFSYRKRSSGVWKYQYYTY